MMSEMGVTPRCGGDDVRDGGDVVDEMMSEMLGMSEMVMLSDMGLCRSW